MSDTNLKSVFDSFGVVSFLDPPSLRRRWTSSRLAVRADGTTIPVLHLLATAAFGHWDPLEQEPYWKDRDWRNESLSNVALSTIALRGSHGRPTKLNIPSGTREYYRAYREQNREKLKEHQRRYRKKVKELIAIAKELEGVDEKTASQTGLEDILSEVRGKKP